MLYPLYLHGGDKGTAHGITFPDFPGCFTAADNWTDLPLAIQESIQTHFYGERDAIPAPSALDVLMSDPKYHGGLWMLFDIDLLQINALIVNDAPPPPAAASLW
jgi:predicted RNase H-like HicB family nuclease